MTLLALAILFLPWWGWILAILIIIGLCLVRDPPPRPVKP
jgi:hypothetical protein